MKHLFLSLLAAMLLAGAGLTQAVAQKNFGVKAGLNIYNVHTPDVSFKSKAGFTGGLFFNARLNDFFDIQPEVLYSQQGFRDGILLTDDASNPNGTFDMKLTTHNINIPVVVKFYPSVLNFYFEAGPQLGICAGNKYKMPTYSEDNGGNINTEYQHMDLKPFNFGMIFGMGYETPQGISLSVRYDLGLTKTGNYFGSITNRGCSVTIGYNIMRWGGK